MRLAAVAILCVLSACGREELEGLGEGADSGTYDVPTTFEDATFEDATFRDATFEDATDSRIGADCTNAPCGAGLVCVHPSCGGGADSGVNCTSHFPFCVAVPPSCADPANCACYPQDTCMHMGSCVMILNGQLYCANA